MSGGAWRSKGKADLDDVDEGKVKVRTDEGKVTTQISSERRTVTVEDSVWFGSMGAKKLDAAIATYKFERRFGETAAGQLRQRIGRALSAMCVGRVLSLDPPSTT